jgi:hypothetical protein
MNTNDWHPNPKITYPSAKSIASQGLPQSEITFADLAKNKAMPQALSVNGIWGIPMVLRL